MSRTALTGLAPSRPLRAFALTLVLFAAMATAGAQSASACVAQPFSPSPLSNSFEGADGDQCDSDGLGPKRDWQNVVGQDGFVSTTDAPSDADTMYGSNNAGLVGGSTDENIPDSWNFTIGNLGAPKYDALAAYSFTDFSDKLFVDLAFVRAASSGATFLAFELNQAQPGYRLDANESDPTQPFSVPTRSRGDLLVTYNVSTQGAIALGLCVWDGNEHAGQWEVFSPTLNGAAITNQTCPALSSTLYQAALNDALGGRQGDIPAAENYVGSGIIGEGRFGEAVVNLTDALRDPSNPTGPQPCIDFGYVWMHSRSSDSLTSSQQDFILPTKPVSIGNCSVEGKKFNDANGDGDNDGSANGEPFLGGWTMFVDYDADGVLDNNKDATFVNDMDGIVEAGEEEPYDVTSDGTDGRPLGSYRITDVQNSAAAPGGTWQVREVLKSAWDCTAAIGAGAVATCPERTDTDPDTALGFQLAWTNNEAFTGRDFGNRRQPATLKVVKHVVTDNGGTATAANWSLHVKSGATEVTGSPQAGSETGDVYTLADGASYVVSETGGPSGYAASFSGDCDSSGNVTVAAGTQKVCTITNNDVAPTVKVVKHVINDNGGTATASDWSLHLKSGANEVGTSPNPGSEAGTTYTVLAGAFKVSETGGPSGYAASFSGDCDEDGDISVAVGQDKVCTITNDDVAPTVKVVKHVITDNGGTATASDWSLHLKSGASEVGTSPNPGSEAGTTYTVAAGAFKVSETGGPSGYAASFSGDCDEDGDISVTVGQDKVCTITNNDVAPTVKVVKHVITDNGGTATASDWSLHLKSGANEVGTSPNPGSEAGTTYTVAAGAFKVSETGGPSGYAATFSGDCDADGDISVTVGQDKVCTITNNDIAPTVKVVKHVITDNGGTATASDWSLHLKSGANEVGTSPNPGSEAGTTYTVLAGAFKVSETGGPSGYAASFSGDCDEDGDISVTVGQDKVCTITNNDVAPTVKVVKHVITDNGGTATAANWSLHLKSGATEVGTSPNPGSEAGTTYTVLAGAFKVSETGGPSGYAASFSGDCDEDGDISVTVGQDKVCTITNNDVAPTVKVVKHVITDNGGAATASDWSLHLKSGANEVTGSPQDGSENGDTYTVAAGSFSVSETGGPSGYTASFSGDCDANGDLSVTVGQDKTCTITNDDVAPTVKVVKHVITDNGGTATASDWSLHLKSGANEVGTSPNPGSEAGTTYTVAAGAFKVSETGGPSGYAATFSGDCDADGDISVTVGQDKVCTITNNDIAATIEVVKHVITDDGGTATASAWSLHLKSGNDEVTGSPQNGSEAGDTYAVSPGAFSVSETGGPSGYAATFSGDCDADGNVRVAIGDTKTCTITNDDIAPTVKVVKHVITDNGGTATASDWSLHLKSGATEVAGSPQDGSENGDTYKVAAGAFKVSETGGPSGYAATFSGDCDADGDISVTVGQDKVCTITNDDIAPTIKVIKHVITDDGGAATASDWSLHLTTAGTEVAGSPQNGTETGDTYTVAAGAYNVSETGGPTGYAASYSGDCGETGNVSVTVGENKTCTIVNDDIAPRLTIVKHVVNKGGSTAQAADFQMDVTATDASDPHFPGTEQGKTITLDAGQYSVDESGGPSTFAKELSEGCAGTIAVGTEKTCTITNTKVLPGGIVVKKGANWAYHGDTLTFTFEVTNPGTTPLTTVAVTDDKCAPVIGPTQKLGGNQDGQLDAGELWVYTCTMTVPEHVAGDTSLVNVVTMAATDADGEPVNDTDSHTTRILHPAIAIDKSGPATASAGSPVVYGLAVTNPGDVPFLAPNVSVTDPLCDAPPLLMSKNGDTTPDQLDPGDSWSYACRVQTTAGQTTVDNVGSVTAKDSFGGREVTASDPATTVLTQVAAAAPAIVPPLQSGVAGERISSPAAGTARLSGPARCITGPFTVKVTGRGIAQVAYTLDGKRAKTVKSAAGRTVFSMRINPRGQSKKAHRVTARVTFKSATGTRARTLRYVYTGCRAAVAPQFTG